MRELLDDPADWVRAVNVVLAVYSLALLATPRAFRWWSSRIRPARFLLLGLVGITAATTYAITESVWLDVPGGLRVLVYTPALLWLAIGATTLHRYLRRHPHDS